MRVYIHLAFTYSLRWSLKRSVKWTRTGSAAFSTNESAWKCNNNGHGLSVSLCVKWALSTTLSTLEVLLSIWYLQVTSTYVQNAAVTCDYFHFNHKQRKALCGSMRSLWLMWCKSLIFGRRMAFLHKLQNWETTGPQFNSNYSHTSEWAGWLATVKMEVELLP